MSTLWVTTLDLLAEGDERTAVGYGQATADHEAAQRLGMFDRTIYVSVDLDPLTVERPIKWKLYDDDGEHYYSGIVSADAFGLAADSEHDPVYDILLWGQTDAGATDLVLSRADMRRHGLDAFMVPGEDRWTSIF